MIVRTITQAKRELDDLVARVENGEEVIITRRGKSIAKIVPYEKPSKSGPPKTCDIERQDLDLTRFRRSRS